MLTWTPQVLWPGGTAFVLACGPSVDRFSCQQLLNLNVIAVNAAAYELAPFAPVMFFGDAQWFAKRRDRVAAFAGLIVTTSRRPAQDPELGYRIKRVAVENRATFLRPRSGAIRNGRSSGQVAISLAIGLGATRIVLVGFDMRQVDGAWHFHREYGSRDYAETYARIFIPAFNGWAAAAEAIGVSIVNATPGSALLEFPFTDLDREVRGAFYRHSDSTSGGSAADERREGQV